MEINTVHHNNRINADTKHSAGYTPSVILSPRQTSCYTLSRRLKLDGDSLRCTQALL
jgi:hypothetical protein